MVSCSPSTVRLLFDVTMSCPGVKSTLLEMTPELIGKRNRSMPPPGTPNGDGDITLPFPLVKWHQIIEQFAEPSRRLVNLAALFEIFDYR